MTEFLKDLCKDKKIRLMIKEHFDPKEEFLEKARCLCVDHACENRFPSSKEPELYCVCYKPKQGKRKKQ